MKKRELRFPADFKREADRVLKPLHNLHMMYNTYTFVAWWVIFGVIVGVSQWTPPVLQWILVIAGFIITTIQTRLWFPSTNRWLQNSMRTRELADEAQRVLSRDGITPRRMPWGEILFGTGRLSRKWPQSVRDDSADWCMTQRELLAEYVDGIPREIETRRRERRNRLREEWRNQKERATPRRKVTTPPILPVLAGATRSVLPQVKRREKAVRPVTPQRRREHRPKPHDLTADIEKQPARGLNLRCLEEVVELLDLTDLIPDNIDHEHVRAIIVWGCMNPGKRGRRMVKAQYVTEQNARRNVVSKLGQAYDPARYEAALAWLRHTRVVISDHKRKRHQPVLAINPHYADGVGVGEEVIKRALATLDAIKQLTST